MEQIFGLVSYDIVGAEEGEVFLYVGTEGGGVNIVFFLKCGEEGISFQALLEVGVDVLADFVDIKEAFMLFIFGDADQEPLSCQLPKDKIRMNGHS